MEINSINIETMDQLSKVLAKDNNKHIDASN